MILFLSDLIFEDAFWSVGSGSFQSTAYRLLEKEASSKNNATTYLVWWQQHRQGYYFFICLSGCSDCFVVAGAGISIQFSVQIVIAGLVFSNIWVENTKASAIAETMYFDVLANKK